MFRRITGGMTAALLLCLAAGATHTQARNWDGPKGDNTIATNKSAADATTTLTATATVNESPRWDETADYDPLRHGDATQNTSDSKGSTITSVKATQIHTRATRARRVDQTAWWAKGESVADSDPLPRGQGRAPVEWNRLTGVSG